MRTGREVQARGLSKSFGGVVAVWDVSLDFRPGEIVALVGPNGAGKTTIFNLLTNTIRADAGTVTIGQTDITKKSPQEIVRAGMVRSWQQVRLFAQMSAIDNVALAIPNQPSEKLWPVFFRPRAAMKREREAKRLAHEHLAFVGMQEFADVRVADLSFGQQKAVAIARVLATGCDILLLDEPTSGVDPRAAEEAINLVKKVAASGKSVCIVEHSLHVVEALADRVIFLDQGQVLAEGTCQSITSRPDLAALYFGRKATGAAQVSVSEQELPVSRSSAAESSKCALWLDSLSAGYGKRDVIFDVNLQVEPGEIVTVVGHNGAGKTTLLKAVLGLLDRRSGIARFFGQDLMRSTEYTNVRRGIAFSQAETPVFRPLSVRENLRLAAFATGASHENERLDFVYELFPRLRDRTTQKAGTLSGGEQRMLAVGMALMGQPRLLLLDEPSLGLAPVLAEQMFEVIRNLCKLEGIAVLLIEQQVRAALEVADYVYFLRLGQIAHHESAAAAAMRPDYWQLF